MSLLQEFKEFAIKGNAVELAVGVVVGGAFSKIVCAIVENLIMPLISLFTGGVNFTSLSIKLANPVALAGLPSPEPATFAYGKFIQATVDFFVVALVLFLIVKALNKLKKAEAAPPTTPSTEQVLLTEIRDLLLQRQGAAASPGSRN